MTIHDARARLRALGRRVTKLTSGRYRVRGVYGTVRACDLPTLAQAFELMEQRP